MRDFCKNIKTGNDKPSDIIYTTYRNAKRPDIKIVFAPYYRYFAVWGLQEAIGKEFASETQARQFIEKHIGK